MRKSLLFPIAFAAILVSCSSDNLVNDSVGRETSQTPIGFRVQKQNITRSANLETVNHFNFGVWAWKVNGNNQLADAEVMNNYLVGWSNNSDKGYYVDDTKTTTYATTPGTTADHKSPWFYEGLGTSEYTYSDNAGYYKKTDEAYMANNSYQYLRYWDLAYVNTNFYCYTPYNKNVTFDKATNTMTFGAANTIRDGYEEPQNSDYGNIDRSLSEFMYAGVQATNSALADVTIPFQHMGAQLFIRFYEDIPGYKVEIIDLCDDHGQTSKTGDITKGIQATPAIKTSDSYSNGSYYTTSGATLTFDSQAKATYTPNWGEGSKTATNAAPLMFKIPQAGRSTSDVAPANLTSWNGHNVIQELLTTGTQAYSYSPTIYYPVAQPTTSNTGFTFHISYRIIAEDNQEVITVHNATVHVPVKGKATVTKSEGNGTEEKNDAFITAWQPNVKYTYTFRITRGSTGTTDPNTDIDPTDPEAKPDQSLFPIVFDAATIDDYTVNFSEYIVSGNTTN